MRNDLVAVGLLFCSAISPSIGVCGTLQMPFSTTVRVINDSDEGVDGGSILQRIIHNVNHIDHQVHKGINQVIFNYVTYYRDNGDDIYFHSNEMIATMDLKSDGVYKMVMPELHSARDARMFTKNPVFTLFDAGGFKVPLKIDTLVKNGAQLGRKYLKESRVYNACGKNAASADINLLRVSVPNA